MKILDNLIDPEIERALAGLPNRVNELGFDDWGFSPTEARALFAIARRIHDYFHPSIQGIENLPPGRALVVANHSGQVPFDGVVIAVACLLRAQPPRLARAMVERWFPTVPYLNEMLTRAGAVLGDPVNCRNLLEDDQMILVFPEGARGSGKVWKDRYRLQGFGRGFLRLALQTDTPIVPVGVVGGEESIISVHNWKGLARLLGTPYWPVSPLGYFPLPVKFHVRFGEPMRFTGRFDDEDAVLDEKVAAVEARVQALVDGLLSERKSLFF
ncbi:MAG: lysophospholipid acyltransferase family protein [Byssovorax sp.]